MVGFLGHTLHFSLQGSVLACLVFFKPILLKKSLVPHPLIKFRLPTHGLEYSLDEFRCMDIAHIQARRSGDHAEGSTAASPHVLAALVDWFFIFGVKFAFYIHGSSADEERLYSTHFRNISSSSLFLRKNGSTFHFEGPYIVNCLLHIY